MQQSRGPSSSFSPRRPRRPRWRTPPALRIHEPGPRPFQHYELQTRVTPVFDFDKAYFDSYSHLGVHEEMIKVSLSFLQCHTLILDTTTFNINVSSCILALLLHNNMNSFLSFSWYHNNADIIFSLRIVCALIPIRPQSCIISLLLLEK